MRASKFCLPSIAGLAALITGNLQGGPPDWWTAGSQPVIINGAASSPSAVATVGQAKWMAYRALQTIEDLDPTLAAAISDELVGSGKPIASWATPSDAAAQKSQYAPLLIGQLKAIAAPFYTQINAVAPDWLSAERAANQTENGGIYPWTDSTSDDANSAPATLGQLKAVFALHFTEDTDEDGVSDFAMWVSAGDPDGDLDGDGVTNGAELLAGTDPRSMDTDGDGIPDGSDPDPLNPNYSAVAISGALRILTPNTP